MNFPPDILSYFNFSSYPSLSMIIWYYNLQFQLLKELKLICCCIICGLPLNSIYTALVQTLHILGLKTLKSVMPDLPCMHTISSVIFCVHSEWFSTCESFISSSCTNVMYDVSKYVVLSREAQHSDEKSPSAKIPWTALSAWYSLWHNAWDSSLRYLMNVEDFVNTCGCESFLYWLSEETVSAWFEMKFTCFLYLLIMYAIIDCNFHVQSIHFQYFPCHCSQGADCDVCIFFWFKIIYVCKVLIYVLEFSLDSETLKEGCLTFIIDIQSLKLVKLLF